MRLLGAIDLTRLCAALENEKLHPSLVKAVKLAAAIGSTRDDLLDAIAALRLIAKITDENQVEDSLFGHDEGSTIVGALFDRAIILYARATTPKGERLNLIGTPSGTDDRMLHEEILRIRSSVVAHFGRGDAMVDGPFYKEAVLLNVFADGDMQKNQVSVYTQRTANRTQIARKLTMLIERRLDDVMARYEPLQISVHDSLNEAIKNDPTILSRLADYHFDELGFFATDYLAKTHRQWMSNGGASGRAADATYVPEA